MKVVLVSGVFPPEHTFSAQMGAETAEELARRGHSVHVYALFPNHPKGRLVDGFKRDLYSAPTAGHGCTLTHCFSTFAHNSKMLKQICL
jgi:hypothetical protein